MGDETGIAWTDSTFNPWWGCERVSDGCKFCYAEQAAARFGHQVWGKTAPRRFMSDKYWNDPVRWNRKAEAAGERRRVFCASMADVFEDRPELVEPRSRLFDLIAATPALDWQLLTKRPQNVTRLAARWTAHGWPDNVWLGTTVEHQAAANERIPVLVTIPAKIRFLSCEPLLGPIDLTPWLWHTGASTAGPWYNAAGDRVTVTRDGRDLGGSLVGGQAMSRTAACELDWVIVGGESGPHRRRFDVAWAEQIRIDCAEAEIAFFFKQHGGLRPTDGGCLLGGAEHKALPTRVAV